jgi:hypothetical protein
MQYISVLISSSSPLILSPKKILFKYIFFNEKLVNKVDRQFEKKKDADWSFNQLANYKGPTGQLFHPQFEVLGYISCSIAGKNSSFLLHHSFGPFPLRWDRSPNKGNLWNKLYMTKEICYGPTIFTSKEQY